MEITFKITPANAIAALLTLIPFLGPAFFASGGRFLWACLAAAVPRSGIGHHARLGGRNLVPMA